MRKVFFWLHLCAGVIAGLVIFIMSVTGVLLMYEKQMVSWFDARTLPPIAANSRLPISELLTKAKESRGSLPASVALASSPTAPAQLAYGRDLVYQDPTTGQLLGSGSPGIRQFFRSVTDWHRWLAMKDANRPKGRMVTGASNLAFLFIVLSGAYLWLPRVWTAASVRAVTWFRGGLSGKARDFNWHNVIGIWCFVPLVFVVASGTVISYPWASNLVYKLAGSPPPAAPDRRPEGPGRQRPEGAAPDFTGLDALWTKAAGHTSDWRMLTMRVPSSGRAPVAFTIDRGYGGQPQKRVTLTLDRETGDVKSSESFGDLNRGRQVRTWMRFVHTGEFYGIPGQTIAGIASLGAAVLAYTGIALSLRRFFAWRSRRARGFRQKEIQTPTVA